MPTLRAFALLVVSFAPVTASAATITQQFDLTLVGDDPSQGFSLPHPFLSTYPLEATFMGYGEALKPLPYMSHGGNVLFIAGSDFAEVEFPLPPADAITGPVQVPITLSRTYTNAPTNLSILFVSDNFDELTHYNGSVTLTGTIPEPSTLAMLIAALPLGYLAYRRRR